MDYTIVSDGIDFDQESWTAHPIDMFDSDHKLITCRVCIDKKEERQPELPFAYKKMQDPEMQKTVEEYIKQQLDNRFWLRPNLTTEEKAQTLCDIMSDTCEHVLGRVKPRDQRPPKAIAQALRDSNVAYRNWRRAQEEEISCEVEEAKDAWQRARRHYEYVMWKDRVEGAKGKHEEMNNEDKRIAWASASKIANRKIRTRVELTPDEEEEFMRGWEDNVFSINNEMELDEGFRGILDRVYADFPKYQELSREYYLPVEDLYSAMKTMNPNKAPGPDGIRLWLLFYGGAKLSSAYLEVAEEMWRDSVVPECWRRTKVIPLYKAGNKKEWKNWRPISLSNFFLRIYDRIITQKLRGEVEEKKLLHESQFGFRRRRSTNDQIWVV